MMLKLIRTDQDSPSTSLVPGIHVFGRGVFLDCKDRRVARSHGQLTVSEDNKVILTALHKNPCFVIVKNSSGMIAMSKGMTKELKEGDEFGLLPDKHWYRLTKNEECEKETLQECSSTCEKRSEATVKSLDSLFLLGTNVGKEEPSTLDTTVEITDKDTLLQHTTMSQTSDIKCKPSSRTKRTKLSSESLQDETLSKMSPPQKKGRYHRSLCETAPTCDAPEELMKDLDLNSEDEDDADIFFPCSEETQAEVQPRQPADGEQPKAVDADQRESSGPSTHQVVAAVVPEAVMAQVGASALTEATQTTQEDVEFEEEDWRDVPGPSGLRQRREYNTYSDDSDCDSDFSVEYSNEEISKGDEERGKPLTGEDDYTLFVAESDESADSDAFLWHDIKDYSVRREAFAEPAGPTRLVSDPYTAFTAIWDESIMEEICVETNRYFEQDMEREVRSEHSRTKYWRDTNVHEMYTFFAFIILMGIIHMPSVKCYFSLDFLMHHPAFSYIMSKHRYVMLSAFLHFVNNEDLPTYTGNKKLFKIQSLIDHCNRKFQELYIPSQNIAIDESLTLWKGKLSWRQYMATKAAKFGIKTFELCESATGYLWSFAVYTGKSAPSTLSPIVPEGANKSTKIVLSLIEPLLNKGYTVWMDNWFNSPFLARFLKNRKTDCAGTLRANQKNVPSELRHKQVEKGAMFGLASACCAVFAWLDKKRVSLISTFHTDRMVEVSRNGRSVVTKPEIVRDYNSFMGGVDKKDQMLSAYLVERKRGKKWYVKFFKRLLNVSILNARILYEASTKTEISHLQFRLCVIREILDRHLESARPRRPPPPPPSSQSHCSTTPANHTFVDNGHLLVKSKSRECVVCNREGRRKHISFQCNDCLVPLCVDPCFYKFHKDPAFRNFFSAGTTRRRPQY